jgi:DNA (cytosine-5)-methyltransferase 1
MWNGEDVAPTLTKQNAGGDQRMPDKNNFNCIIAGGSFSHPDVASTIRPGIEGKSAFPADSGNLNLISVIQDARGLEMGQNGMGISDKDGAYTVDTMGGQGVGIGGRDTGYTLRANPSHSGDKGDGGVNTNLAICGTVRRLTPRECERLQGFPDDYTLIPYRGKPATDGHRYKALGNSMAVPVMNWIGKRIQMVEQITGGQQCVKKQAWF